MKVWVNNTNRLDQLFNDGLKQVGFSLYWGIAGVLKSVMACWLMGNICVYWNNATYIVMTINIEFKIATIEISGRQYFRF